MSSKFSLLNAFRQLRIAGVLLLAPCAFGQPATSPGQAKHDTPTGGPNDEGTYRASFNNAKALAKASNVANAEAILTTLNLAKANTSAWHLETAQRLVQLAEQLARDGQPANVAALVTSALQHTALADTPSEDAPTRAAARMLAGFIHERFLANATAAIASYQAAAQVLPTSAAAREAAERMQRTDDTFRGKSGGH